MVEAAVKSEVSLHALYSANVDDNHCVSLLHNFASLQMGRKKENCCAIEIRWS
jgi:hypothetical protein